MIRFKKKIYADFIWTFLTQLLILLSSFLINKIFALRLGVDSFGMLNIARRGATLIGFVMLSGQGLAIVKYLSFEKKSKNIEKLVSLIIAGFSIIFSMTFLILIFMTIFKNGFVKVFFANANLAYIFFPMLFFAFSTTLSTYIISVYRGIGKFTIFNYIQVISQLTIILFFLLIKSNEINKILVIWAVITALIPIFFLLVSIIKRKKLFSVKIKEVSNDIKKLANYGIPRILGEFVQFSYYLVPLILVNAKFGDIETSLFSASTAILQLFLPFFSYIGLILLPHTSAAIADNRFSLIKKKINKGMLFYFMLSSLLVFVGIMFTPFILKILYSSEFVEGSKIARILLLSLVPRSIFLLLRNPIDAISNKPYNTYNLVISFIFMIVLMVVGTTIDILALSFVLSDLLLCLLSMFIWFKSDQIIKKGGSQ